MKPASSRAFTLLELLVAVAVTLVVAGLMLGVTSGVLNLWRRTQAGHQVSRPASVDESASQRHYEGISNPSQRRFVHRSCTNAPISSAP